MPNQDGQITENFQTSLTQPENFHIARVPPFEDERYQDEKFGACLKLGFLIGETNEEISMRNMGEISVQLSCGVELLVWVSEVMRATASQSRIDRIGS